MQKNIGKIFIRLNSNIEEPEYEFSIPESYEQSKYNYSLFVDCSPKCSYEEIINNKKEINDAIKIFNEEPFDEFGYAREHYEDEEEYNENKNSFESIRNNNKITHSKIKNSKYQIELQGNPEDVIEFINHSEDINSKNVVLIREDGYVFSIEDRDKLHYIMKNLDNLENISVFADGNNSEVPIKSYIDTIDYIDDIVNSIKKYDLSPLEQVMYAYDIVRDRKYKQETKKQNARESRDLTSVLLGDRIVCSGFSEILDKVCKKLGFKSHIQHLRSEDMENLRGHARNSVHIKDDKYNIDGIYFFDSTWDCKRDNTNNHFNSYFFFGMTANNMFKLDNMDDNPLKSEFNYLAKISRIFSRTPELVETENLLTINSFSRKYLESELLDFKEIIGFNSFYNKEKKEEIIKKVLKFLDLFTRDISKRDFIRLVSNVRAVEHYEYPEKFPYSTKKIAEIVKKSGRDYRTTEEKLLIAIFGEKVETPQSIMEEKGIDKKVEGVHLAKALRLTLEKKQNEDTQ